MPYTNEEALDMLLILGECLKNFRAAERLYAQRYPDRQRHSYKVFKRLADRVLETGCVQPGKNKNKRIERPVRNEIAADVLAAVQINPHDSTRQISRDAGVGHMTVWRIINEHKMHPYKISLHQELEEGDPQRRIDFCTFALNKTIEDRTFFNSVLWCDEATFRSTGEVNRHNMHYWAIENPHWIREVNNQRYWSLNTWCGILGNKIIGPYFFDGTLNGDMYNHFLINVRSTSLCYKCSKYIKQPVSWKMDRKRWASSMASQIT